ncbi:MAG TPA: glutamate 5-kinase [Anaerohalosphaeraceae bacterium]|jgi:glutamate 5-kinase|nr:glutamate 5-kinase [Anaerohalosphaeraceae bacterium]HRT51501.1 glutamate 5-kinase [Anaerohalosphaeraceae bacterium]HRT87164.1 glutamate 5-kinase [Anaerohalosphaeraceae bacterium]
MRNFSLSKRIVVKIGTATLSKDGGVDIDYVRDMAGQLAVLIRDGRQVVIVTSGAIGMGAGLLKLKGPVTDMKMRQACAAIGQPLLMQEYRRAFREFDIHVAQVLLTAEVLNHRKTYLNLRNSVETLLRLGVVPVLNENDSVSTAEIGTAFGDNDKLSALVASKIDADLLIMLSDIDALYDKDPRKYPDAQPIDAVFEISDKITRGAGSRGSTYSTGGMRTKIEAAKIAAQAGCRIVLAHGRAPNVIARVMAGERIGTIFMPKRRLSNRARWILNSAPAGTIHIDEGAMDAVRRNKSLLPSGVTGVEGHFKAGDVVMLNQTAKAVTSLGAAELATVAGKHSGQIRKILGANRKDVVATPEDIVFLDY